MSFCSYPINEEFSDCPSSSIDQNNSEYLAEYNKNNVEKVNMTEPEFVDIIIGYEEDRPPEKKPDIINCDLPSILVIKSEPSLEDEEIAIKQEPGETADAGNDNYIVPDVLPPVGKMFKTSSNLEEHKKIHSNTVKPFECQQCLRQFPVITKLVKHQGLGRCKKQTTDPIVCHVCNKVFQKEYLLKSHLLKHTNERPYICDECQMTFKYKTTLIRHIQLHNGIKPYSCKICRKKFTHAGLIKPHMRKHTGEKPYTCPICNKAFAHKQTMQRHAQRHEKIKHLVCDVCNKTFKKQSRLKYHMRIHTKDKPFACEVCTKTFSHRYNILRHHSCKHPNDRYQCANTDASVAKDVWDQVIRSKMEMQIKIDKRTDVKAHPDSPRGYTRERKYENEDVSPRLPLPRPAVASHCVGFSDTSQRTRGGEARESTTPSRSLTCLPSAEHGRVRVFIMTEWTNDLCTTFMELYQMEPIIWNPKNPCHKDKIKVNKAWDRISKKLNIPIQELKTKKISLMATFRGYLRKKKASIKSGAGINDVYKPIWFLYELMESFLTDTNECLPTINTERMVNNSQAVETEEESSMNEKSPMTQSSIASISQQSFPPQHPRRRAKGSEYLINEASKQMKDTFNTLNSVIKHQRSVEDDCDLYCKLLARKLRALPENKRVIFMYEIDGMFVNRLRNTSSPSLNFSASHYIPERPPSSQSSYSEPLHDQIRVSKRPNSSCIIFRTCYTEQDCTKS